MQRGDQVEHRLRVLDRLAAHGLQDVARANAGGIGRAAALDAGDQGAAGVGQAEGFGELGGHFLRLDADPAARHGAGADDLFHDVAHRRYRDGEADAQRTAGARVDRGVDADQMAAAVDQGAAGVAGVDRGVGLDEVLEGVDPEVRAPEGRDDAHGHRLADAEGIADGQHDVADDDVVHSAERDRRQLELTPFLGEELEHGEVGFRVAADHARRQGAAVVEGNLDLVGAFDDVVVGEHVAVGADDDPGAEAGITLRLAFLTLAEEVAEDRVVEQRMALRFDLLRGVDMHHRWQGAARRFAEGCRRRAVLAARRRLLQRDHRRGAAAQPFRLERADDEDDGETDGDGLCKNQPESAHNTEQE